MKPEADMSDIHVLLDLPLVRTSLLLSVACLVLLLVLRRNGHSVFARLCWCGVLLLGWFWLQIPCQIPWHTVRSAEIRAQSSEYENALN